MPAVCHKAVRYTVRTAGVCVDGFPVGTVLSIEAAYAPGVATGVCVDEFPVGAVLSIEAESTSGAATGE